MLAILPGQARWIERVARAGIVRWTEWPGKEKSVMRGGTKVFVGEIGWCWPVEAKRFVDEMD